jgi:hypothetical protein
LAKYDPAKAQPDTRPDWSYWGRPSNRTEAEREERYQEWLTEFGHEDTDDRRELFWRRYTRPRPPAGLSVPTITKESTAA